jgi:D-cysteine desulfhydrase/L-cysteate sulfo-lyase
MDHMANLSAEFGVELYVKRDDCTGLAFGGNKVRQLEFYFGEAKAQGADTVLITGAVQSNFVRTAAAAARLFSMTCHIQLEERVARDDALYRTSGNVLLDRLLGATLHAYPDGEDEAGADRRLNELADDLAGQGRRPYIIPLGPGYAPLGALGYIVAAAEILDDMKARDLTFDRVVVASGSGNTHAGLLFGLRALGSAVPVTGVCVRRSADLQVPRLAARCREIADFLKMASPVSDADIVVTDAFLAPGYGSLNPATIDALTRAARSESLILDPTYTAKTMAGFLDLAGKAGAGETMLFIHTGGTPAIFAYGADLV